jgi:hypothetical protein
VVDAREVDELERPAEALEATSGTAASASAGQS